MDPVGLVRLVGLVGHDVLNLHSLLFHIWPRSLVGILSEVESECFPGATITLVVVLRDGDGTHEENSVDRQPQNFPQIMIIKHKYKYKYKYKHKSKLRDLDTHKNTNTNTTINRNLNKKMEMELMRRIQLTTNSSLKTSLK